MALKTLTRDSFKWTNGRGHDQKPILYSVKNNSLGLGKSLHTAHTDNWWERAFDNSLKSLSVSETHDGGIKVVQEEVKGGGIGLKQVVAMGKGRYVERIKFVKGGLLEGTLRELKTEVVERIVERDVTVEENQGLKKVEGGRKRKREGSEVEVEAKEETKEERRKRRKEEKAAKELRRLEKQEKKEKKARKEREKEKKKNLRSKSKSSSRSSRSEEEEEASSTTTSPPPTKKQKKSFEKAPLPTPPSSGEEEEKMSIKKDRKDKKDKERKKSKKEQQDKTDSDSKSKSKPNSKSRSTS